MSRIRLNVWEDRQDPNRLMILYDHQVPAPESYSTTSRWRVYYTFTAYNPLVPPYPEGCQLFRARHAAIYPYELIDVKPMLDVYNVDAPGTYFVAYVHPHEGATKLPFKDIYIYVMEGEKVAG
jgi:hypothetical protein